MDSRQANLGAQKARLRRVDFCFSSSRCCLGVGNGALKTSQSWIKYTNMFQIRTRNYNRAQLPDDPTDWSEPRFGWIFTLFMLNWVFSVCSRSQNPISITLLTNVKQLWHNIVYWWIGALTNSPQKLTHYVGVFRGVLGAGEAVCFGLDSIKIPFIAEAGGILLFYSIGIVSFYYLLWAHIKDTNYDHHEEGAVIPNHILHGERLTPGQNAEEIARNASVSHDRPMTGEKLSEKVKVDGDSA